MSDTIKLVAAILAAGRCQGLAGANVSEYVDAYKVALKMLEKDVADAAKAEAKKVDATYDKIGKGIP